MPEPSAPVRSQPRVNDSTSTRITTRTTADRPDHGRQVASPAEEHLGALHARRGPVDPLRPALDPRRRGVGRGHGRRGPTSGEPPGHDLGALGRRRERRRAETGRTPRRGLSWRAAVLAGAVLAGAVLAGAVLAEAAWRTEAARRRAGDDLRALRVALDDLGHVRGRTGWGLTAGRPSGTAGGRGPGRAGPRVRPAGSPEERPGSMRCPGRSRALAGVVGGGVVGGEGWADRRARTSGRSVDLDRSALGRGPPGAGGPAEPSPSGTVPAELGSRPGTHGTPRHGLPGRRRSRRSVSDGHGCRRAPGRRLSGRCASPAWTKVPPIPLRRTRMRRHRFPVPSSEHPSSGPRPRGRRRRPRADARAAASCSRRRAISSSRRRR